MRATTTLAALAVMLASAGCTVDENSDASEADLRGGEAGAEADVPSEPAEGSMDRWNVRLDQEDATGDFRMAEEGGGWSVTTGPAGITWRPSDLVQSGDFTARATFREREADPGHREAFGLLVGGQHLEAPDQRYTYFLVRGTGEYMVKHREGEETSTLVDWTPSDAVNAIDAAGTEPSNTLEIRAEGDSIRFVVNDEVVETLPVDQVRPYGMVGLRVNHRLNLEVSDFEVEGEGVGQPGG